MPSTTTFEPGDVLLIPFPFTDFTTLKQRPCVVLSSGQFNRTHPDIIAAAITSQLPEEPRPEEYLLQAQEQQTCGLLKPSLVKTGKIVTIDKRLVRKRLGQLPAASTERLLVVVRRLFGEKSSKKR